MIYINRFVSQLGHKCGTISNNPKFLKYYIKVKKKLNKPLVNLEFIRTAKSYIILVLVVTSLMSLISFILIADEQKRVKLFLVKSQFSLLLSVSQSTKFFFIPIPYPFEPCTLCTLQHAVLMISTCYYLRAFARFTIYCNRLQNRPRSSSLVSCFNGSPVKCLQMSGYIFLIKYLYLKILIHDYLFFHA